jgi:hypothetical protein
MFFNHYRTQMHQHKIGPGWQQSVAPVERAHLGLRFFTQYCLLKPDVTEIEAMRVSFNVETSTFMAAQNKDMYVNNIKHKLVMMSSARQQRLQQGSMGQIGQSVQIGIIGQPGSRQGTSQQFNSAFPKAQLQRPIEMSSVPTRQGQNHQQMNLHNHHRPKLRLSTSFPDD